jgi:hypothetical protein
MGHAEGVLEFMVRMIFSMLLNLTIGLIFAVLSFMYYLVYMIQVCCYNGTKLRPVEFFPHTAPKPNTTPTWHNSMWDLRREVLRTEWTLQRSRSLCDPQSVWVGLSGLPSTNRCAANNGVGLSYFCHHNSKTLSHSGWAWGWASQALVLQFTSVALHILRGINCWNLKIGGLVQTSCTIFMINHRCHTRLAWLKIVWRPWENFLRKVLRSVAIVGCG